MGEPAIWVDTRWKGNYGIARYSTAIVSRLPEGHRPAHLRGNANGAAGMLQLAGLVMSASDVFYSPGFMPILTRARQVLTLHDLIHLSTGSTARRMFYNSVIRSVIRRAGIVLTVSNASAAAIRQWVNDPAVDIVIAPNGVEVSEGDQRPDASIPDPFFLCVSNVKRHKNLPPLLEAVRAARVNLVLVVPRSDLAEARRLAEGVPGNAPTAVVVSGISDAELSWLYRHAAATVQPSLEEGFGLPAAESIAHGTPVLYAAECRAVADVVQQDGIAVSNARESVGWQTALIAIVGGRGPRRIDAGRFHRQWDESARIVSGAIGRTLLR